jgi:hypothetical protein
VEFIMKKKTASPEYSSLTQKVGGAVFRPFVRIFHAIWTPRMPTPGHPLPPAAEKTPSVTTTFPPLEFLAVGTTLTEMTKPYVNGLPVPPYSPAMPAGTFSAPFPIGPLFRDFTSLAPEEPRPLDTTRMIPMQARKQESEEKNAADFPPAGGLESPMKKARSTRAPSIAPHEVETGEKEPAAPTPAAEEYVSPSAPLAVTPPGCRKHGHRARRGKKRIPPNVPHEKAPETKPR